MEKLGQIEFEEVLFDNISKVVINRHWVEENQVFWNNTVFKMFEEYTFGLEEISIRKQAKLLELFLGNMIKYKPGNDLPEDILNVC